MEKDQISAQIGQRLREIRHSRGLSLDALADLTGVSKPMLGQVERGASNPTVATLWKIAAGLNVPFTAFIAEAPHAEVVRADEQSAFFEDDGRYQVFSTYATPGSPVELFRVRLLPGCRRLADAHAAGVIEALTVSSGTLQLVVQGTSHELAAGDALRFAADVPHTYINPSAVACEAHLAILYPASGTNYTSRPPFTNDGYK